MREGRSAGGQGMAVEFAVCLGGGLLMGGHEGSISAASRVVCARRGGGKNPALSGRRDLNSFRSMVDVLERRGGGLRLVSVRGVVAGGPDSRPGAVLGCQIRRGGTSQAGSGAWTASRTGKRRCGGWLTWPVGK